MPIRPVGFTSNEGGIPDLMAIPHCWFYLKWREWRGDPGCHAHPPRWSHSRWRGDPGSNGHSPLLVLFEMKGNPGSNAPPVGSTSNEEESWIHCPPFRLNLILNEMESWIQCPPRWSYSKRRGAPISDRDMEIGKAIMIEIDIYIKIEIKIERWR